MEEREQIYGIDVSHWSSTMKYDVVMAEGFGKLKKIPAWNYIKASEGTWYRDPLAAWHLGESHRVGLLTGLYHYYREGYSPQKQGRFFSDIYKTLGGTDMPPCLDVEIINNPYLNPINVANCLNEIEEHTGRKPIIYTGYFVWRDKMKAAAWGKNYLLWAADYTPPLNIPAPWTGWAMWQIDDSAGDENWFNGSLDDLKAFCAGTFVPPVTHPIAAPSIVQRVVKAVKNKKKKNKKAG